VSVSSIAARGAFAAKSRIALAGSRRAFHWNLLREADDTAADDRRRASALARYAWDTTVFYREHYAGAGFRRADLDDPEAFDALPTVSKEQVRERTTDFIAGGLPESRRLPSSTGGSTGEPLRVFHDRSAPTAALWWTAYRWWGVAPWENRAVIHRERRTPAERRRERVEWWPTAEIALDARTMTAASMARFVEEWRRCRPVLLNGYVGAVGALAEFLREAGLSVAPPRAIALTAAPITASQRATIESTFAAQAFDTYRSAEVAWIAAECRSHDALHVLPTRLVEVVGDDCRRVSAGTEGSVVVTDLGNAVFPLVRYQLGDRTTARAEPCACGNRRPRIDAVQGRVSDVLRLPGGQYISGGLTGIFNASPRAVRQFQVHQLSDHSITLRVVPGAEDGADRAIDDVAESLRELVERAVEVRVERVASIAHDGGKDRVVRSDVPARGSIA
jgi:phenylacetate-CoA ligase